MAFQTELLEVLDSFGVKNVRDFYRLPPGQQPYFTRRLYKAFVSHFESAIAEVQNSGGVKFHFRTSGDLTATHTNVPTEAFLKKTAFYANRTLISFPFQEVSRADQTRLLRNKPHSQWPEKRRRKDRPFYFGEVQSGPRTGYGGTLLFTGKFYTVDQAAFNDLLMLIPRLRPAIEAGVSELIPVFKDTENVLRSKALGLTSANFRLPELQQQFSEEILVRNLPDRRAVGLSHLLLPHFANVPFEKILEIRDKEADLYAEFQRRFERLLIDAEASDSEERILTFLRDVDSGVRELHRKFVDIEKNYRRKSIYMLIKFISAGLVLMAPVDPVVQKSIAGIVGSLSAFDYLTAREDVAKSKAELHGNHFYVPWLVFRS